MGTFYSLLVKIINGSATLKNSLAVSYKTTLTLTIRSSDHAALCLLKRVWTLGDNDMSTQTQQL